MQMSSLFLSVTNVIISIHFEVLYAFLLRKYGFVLFVRNFIFVWNGFCAEYYVESVLYASLGFRTQSINCEICVRHLLLVFV